MEQNYLQYGDIIFINAPTKPLLDNKTFYIDYIDSDRIDIISLETSFTIKVLVDGSFEDESISNITRVSSSTLKGFALQNSLVPGKWIELVFYLEIPNIKGLITNLENDRIEVTIMDGKNEKIYIDFEYKGIPSFLKKVIINDTPLSNDKLHDERSSGAEIDVEELEIPELHDDIGKQTIRENDSIASALKTLYIGSNDLIFSGEIEKITQRIEKDEKFQKHSIEAQTTDLVDKLLSTIPNNQRTESVLGEVHRIVERYTQLRSAFSKKDDNGTVICHNVFGQNNKPLIELFSNRSNKAIPKWILPVVTNQRKVYTTNENDDEEPMVDISNVTKENISLDISKQYAMQRMYYKSSNSKYTYIEHINEQNHLMTPFTNYENNDNILGVKDVLNNQEVLIDDTTVWNKKDIWFKTKNIPQKFISGSFMGSNRITSDETMHIKSIIIMPPEVTEYSKLFLNGADIMTRSSLNKSFLASFQLLSKFSKKNTNIETKTVDKFEEINYEFNRMQRLCMTERPYKPRMTDDEFQKHNLKRREEKFINSDFMKGLYNYKLDINNPIQDDSDKFMKFLYTIIPSTYDLIKSSSAGKVLTKNYSFIEFVNKFLEPYTIYSKNIHFDEGYSLIRFYLKTVIGDYKSKVLLQNKKCRSKIFELDKKKIILFDETSFDIITKGREETYLKCYSKIDDIAFQQRHSSTESLSNIVHIDGGNMMTNIIISKNQHLVINPEFVESVLNNTKPDIQICSRNFIAKKYLSIEELEIDNGKKELYYDTQFDDTPYTILDLYKRERSLSSFKEFLTRKLVEKHSCPVDLSDEVSDNLIRGKKIVRDGEYAILLSTEHKYYRWNQHIMVWVIDNSARQEQFSDDNTVFCNVNDKCIKNENVKTCDNIVEHKNVYIAEFKSRLDELDKRLNIDIHNTSLHLTDLIIRNNNLKYLQLYRQNFLSIELAKSINLDNSLKSPYISLRDNILSHPNFPEKQEYIIIFADRFTRKPIITVVEKNEVRENDTESHFWLYCKETNTKLLPRFLLELAISFKEKTYQSTLDKICSEFGNSDSQGTYFDKNSGYTICKMDFVNADEYTDDGSIITSHSILINDEEKGLTNKTFHKNSKDIDTIFYAICLNLDIMNKTDEFRNFVHKTSIELVDLIENEELYKNKVEFLKRKQKTYRELPYNVFLTQNLIYIISSLVFISIQTTVPPLKTVKTFEECVQSFSGYPMTSSEDDESGLRYLSCVVLKLKSNISPWEGLLNVKDVIFKENIKKKLSVILLRKDIKLMYEKRKLYNDNIKHFSSSVNIDNNIGKWLGILPPIVAFSVKKNISNASKEFFNELIKTVKQGHKNQHQHIAVLKSKIILYGYGIIESINDVVKKKQFLLKSSSNTPFKQNSCCNDSTNITTLQYFISQNSDLLSYIENSRLCEKTISYINNLTTAPVFFYSKDTTHESNVVNTASLQYRDNMFQAFIYYLKYDTMYPVPKIFGKRFPKPKAYESNMTFDQKIEILEKDKSNYNINSLEDLLRTVHSKKLYNASDIFRDNDVYNESHIFQKFLQTRLDGIDSNDIREGSVIKLLHTVYDLSSNELKLHISMLNERIRDDIMQVVQDCSQLNVRDYNIWGDNLNNMSEWKKWNLYNEDEKHKTTIIDFIKNAIFKFSNTYISIIRNDISEQDITKRWRLSEKHNNDIKNFHRNKLFKHLNKFNSIDDAYLSKLNLDELQEVIDLSNIIPTSEKMDSVLCEYLFTFCWLSVFKIFIKSTSELSIGDDFIDGDKNFFQKKIIQLLTAFLDVETENKRIIDISLQQIEVDTFRSKQAEKKAITDTLKELNSDGRKIMGQMKKIGLGIWREGKIGLVKYDPRAYDRNGLQSTNDDSENNDDNENNEDAEIYDDNVENNGIDDNDGYDSGDGDGNNDD